MPSSPEPYRVLAEDGSVVREPLHPPTDAQLLRARRLIRLLRVLDGQMLNAQRTGRISFYGSCRGQEAAVLGSALCLEDGDLCVQALREGGAALLRGYSLRDYVDQVWGNARDRCKGRQMPCHYSDRSIGHLSLSSPVANQLPQAVGMAYALKMRGSDRVVLAYLGDGGTAEADFHTALNFAAVWQAPVVFLCQNNQWAISTPVATQSATDTLAEKALAYGIEPSRADGNDLLAVHDLTRAAVERARRGGGPGFIEALTYRVGAHSTSDDPSRYRDESVTEVWATERDPLRRLEAYLEGRCLLDRAEAGALDAELLATVKAQMAESAAQPLPSLDTMTSGVYAETPPHLLRQAGHLSGGTGGSPPPPPLARTK